MRTLNRCTLLALAAGGLAAQALEAQPAATRPATHTVVRGDNLWDLSQRYLGNAFLWPEIYRLNRDVIEDPHWIFPGEVIRLPGEEPVVAEQPTTPQVPQQPTQPETRVGEAPTIFARPTTPTVTTPRPGGGFIAEIGVVERTTVRAGEVMAAPYVDREGGPRGFGRILKSGDLAGTTPVQRYSLQAYDRVFIQPPVGQVASEGERYMVYKLGPVLEDQGQVMIPTGIVEVTKAALSDVAAVAKVVKLYQEMTIDDRLIPLDTAGVGSTVRPTRVADGPSTKISWVYKEPVLPSVQNFIVLDVTSRNGVRMGDEFLIYLPRARREEDRLGDPEIPIGKAQVVRSTPYGVTAVVLGQEQPAIKPGMSARVTARMP